MTVAKMLACSLALWTTLLWAGDEPKGKPAQDDVFIFGKDLIQLLENDPDAVILYGEKARQYLESAKDRERAGSPSVLVQQCQIRGELLDDHARLQIDVMVRCERDGRRPVPLGLTEGNLVSASIDGGSPFLTRDGPGWTAWVEGLGQHTISIALERPLAGSKSLPALVCTIPEAPITSLELKSLRGVSDVKLTPAAPVTLRPVGDSKPQIEATLGPRNKLDLRWRWSDGQSREAAPLLRAVSEVTATVEAGVIQLKTELRLQVRTGSQPTCELRTRADERVLDLRATDGSAPGWQSSVEGGEQRIIIHFSEPLTSSTELILNSEVPWTGDSGMLRGMTVLGAYSHQSVIALRSAAEFDVAATELVNARRTDSVPAALRSPRTEAAFGAYAQPFQIKLSILPRRAGTSVRTTALFSCDGQAATVIERWQFTVHGGKVSQVDFRLPEHFKASDFVFSDTIQSVREVEAEQGRVARIYLKGSPDAFELRLRATVPLVTARNLTKLELPTPQKSLSELSRVYLAGTRDFAIDPTPDLHTSDEPLDAALARELDGSAQTTRGFQTRAMLDRVAFRISHSPPQLRHLNRVTVTLDDDYATVVQTVEYAAAGAPIRELRLAVPESVRGALSLDTDSGQTVMHSREGELTVRQEGEHAGPPRIELRYRQPLPLPESVGGVRRLAVPLVRALDGPCDFTEATIVAPASLIVQVSSDEWRVAGALAARTNSASNGARLVVRKSGDADSLPLTLAAGLVATQPATVVDRALIQTEVGTRGEWHTRARFLVSAATGTVRLQVPRGGRITRMRWDGKTIAARPAAEADSLELIDPISGNLPGILDVDAEGTEQLPRAAWPSYTWEAPALLGEVAWGRVFWQLTVPDGLVVLRGPARYTDENRVQWRESPLSLAPRCDDADLERWLTGSDPSESLPHSRGRLLYSRLLSIDPLLVRCGSRPVLVLMSSGCVMLVGLVVVAAPRRVRIGVLLGGVMLISALGVLEPVAALAIARSSFLGLALVVLAGPVHAWMLRRSAPRRTVFPEPGQLAKTQGSSGRGGPEFALGPPAPDAGPGSLEPKTTPPRLAARSSSGR